MRRVVPRYHFGGLASDEVPAVLLTGERVMSRDQNKIFEKFAAMLDGAGQRQPPLPAQAPVVVHMNVNALDAHSFAGYVHENKEAVAAAIGSARGDNNPAARGR